jgi:hypothetical protein
VRDSIIERMPQPEARLKSRSELIERARTTLPELKAKYGLALRRPAGQSLFEEAAAMKLPRTVLSPPKIVIPCATDLKDLGRTDPCLIVPSTLPLELLPIHKSLAVGGQVNEIRRSYYALSSYLADEAWRAQGSWNGQPMPLLVSIKGSFKYLVRQKSYFFKCDDFVGADIDQLSPMQPDARELKLGRYHWGSDLSEELTVIVAEY